MSIGTPRPRALHRTDNPPATDGRPLDGTDDPAAAERQRCATISRLAGTLRIDGAFVEQLIASGASIDEARAQLLDRYADQATIRIEVGGDRSMYGEHASQRIGLMAEALASRFGGPPPSEGARQYLRLSTVDFARQLLEARGTSTRMLSKGQVVERALGGLHSTADFPALLSETGTRILRRAYESYQGGLRRACRQAEARDFRPLQKLQIGEAGGLERVNEHGEFSRSTMTEAKETYSLATFGRIFGITRQALVNDDLGAFGDMNTKLGRAAAEFVASQLVALLASNPTMADSVAAFHANHGNLAASGSAIAVPSLGAAFKAMRLQKGLDGVTPIDVTPKYLIVPAALESVGRQVLTTIAPAKVSDVNPYYDAAELVVEPRLDDSSATAWYVAADPAVIDTIEYAFLEGQTGPQLFMKEGWNVDGVEWKVRLDFGAGILDFRGLYKNPGV